jgi:ribulose 1,5-bisphosphate carboxylase large subunit-like protein
MKNYTHAYSAILPELFDIYGHPLGIEAGARAVIQAIEAYKQGISLEDYAEKHKELKVALETWGKEKPV